MEIQKAISNFGQSQSYMQSLQRQEPLSNFPMPTFEDYKQAIPTHANNNQFEDEDVEEAMNQVLSMRAPEPKEPPVQPMYLKSSCCG